MKHSTVVVGMALALAATEAPGGTGILVVAHGGDARWNAHVRSAVERVRERAPAEPAFLMGVPDQSPQQAYGKLVAAGATRIVVVPLFVSSTSDHYEQVRFLAGLRPDYPHAEHIKLTRLIGGVPVSGVTPALDDHPLIAALLADRARALSQDPGRESLVLVAHGPNADDEAAAWNDAIHSLGTQLHRIVPFRDVDVRLLRDDAPWPVKDKALHELRDTVETRSRQGAVVVVPVLVAPGHVADQIPRVLEGIAFRWSGQTLLPDDRVAEWIQAQALANTPPQAGRDVR